MSKTLKIADGLALPLTFATKTAAILAQRRKGKTYTASVVAEEMVAAKQPFVALDPTGAWWGLRASADGKAEGLPVVILGGQHGDVALERTAGRVIADLVVDEPGYYVIDFSLFESGEAERQFAVDFAERLYRAKGQPGKDFALHLFVDEADRFVPQQLRKGSNETSARLLGAFEAIVRRGGLRGLGTTLISQRAAVVNKNVLEMLDILIALRTLGPNDRAAIDGYVEAHGSDEELAALQGSIASLGIGEAWVWEPGADPPLFQRVQIRARHTFNSSATPEPGKARVEPRRLAAVDLAALSQRMAQTIERAKADDPKELKKRISELERNLRAKSLPSEKQISAGEQPSASEQITIKIREVLTDADRELLKSVRDEFAQFQEFIGARADVMLTGLADRAKAVIDEALAKWVSDVEKRRALWLERLGQTRVQRVLDKVDAVPMPPGRAAHTLPIRILRNAPVSANHDPKPQQIARSAPKSGFSVGEATMPPGEKAVLTAAAMYADGVTRDQLGVLTGYKRSSRDSYLARLAQKGWIDASANGHVRASSEGIAALGQAFEPLPTGAALLDWWRGRLPKGERDVLEVLVAANGQPVARESIDEATGFKRSSRDSYLARLSARRLIEPVGRGEVRASAELFD